MLSCKDYSQQVKEYIKSFQIPRVLDIFQIGEDPASDAYIRGKIKDCNEVGFTPFLHHYPRTISQQELIAAMGVIDKDTDGIILQLPVPSHINAQEALKAAVSPKHDVDGFFAENKLPCTPRGIIDWYENAVGSFDGKKVVIIGRSEIVGRPLAKALVDRNATVILCHSHTKEKDLYALCNLADVVVVAVGKPKWFKAKEVATPVIIDVGINRIDGKLCGDVDSEGNTTSYITPVPGGVGLLTRVALLKNLVE